MSPWCRMCARASKSRWRSRLSPFFTAIPNIAKRLADAGAKGLVLFNRFYQPDIDLENLEVVPNLV